MLRLLFTSFLLVLLMVIHGQTYLSVPRTVLVKWAPTGLLPGNISLLGEYNFSPRQSFTAKIGIPINVDRKLHFKDKVATLTMRSFSLLAGFRRYLTDKPLCGFYIEPYFKYVHHSSRGYGNGRLLQQDVIYDFTNEYEGAGIGAQLGVQFLVKEKFIIDLFFFGPELNTALNALAAIEVTNVSPWNEAQAKDAERDIRSLISNFPFMKNRFDISVNPAKRKVSADFVGSLPGMRIGISIGIMLWHKE